MSTATTETTPAKPVSPLREIVRPFIDLVHAPRALWGVNLGYLIEGMVYFGILNYLTIYFSDFVGLDDDWSSKMVGVLTWGITLSMSFLGGMSDTIGIRRALLLSFVLMIAGRVLLAGGPSVGLAGGGLLSPLNLVALGGILLVVIGSGMYQPTAYTAVKQFTTEKNAGMAYAMLYALMNLGGWLPSFFGPVRKHFGITGALWIFAGATVVALVVTALILTAKTVEGTLASAKVAREREQAASAAPPQVEDKGPFSLGKWLREHPLAHPKFAFFIFALIPVQTLFAHNWLTLPKYVSRAYAGSAVGDNFELAVNLNPLLIFILVPIVTALTQKANVYQMMILGTFVMAAPTFLLALGTTSILLFSFLVLSTIGEAMWQPRFLQYAAEIAPEGRTGAYMGIAHFPWFLTKVIVSLYAGKMLGHYVPEEGAQDPETMWSIHACIAIASTVMLVAARNWLGKDFKTKAVA